MVVCDRCKGQEIVDSDETFLGRYKMSEYPVGWGDGLDGDKFCPDCSSELDRVYGEFKNKKILN